MNLQEVCSRNGEQEQQKNVRRKTQKLVFHWWYATVLRFYVYIGLAYLLDTLYSNVLHSWRKTANKKSDLQIKGSCTWWLVVRLGVARRNLFETNDTWAHFSPCLLLLLKPYWCCWSLTKEFKIPYSCHFLLIIHTVVGRLNISLLFLVTQEIVHP